MSIDAVADELETLMEETTAFINRKTGELASVTSEDVALVEEESEPEEDLPQWQIDALPGIREIVYGEDWLALPSKFDIHEWDIMRRFANHVSDSRLPERLQRAIHGRGAFRMFRSVVEDANALELVLLPA